MLRNRLFFLLLITSAFCYSQEWHLDLSSSVELRTLKLTNKADKVVKPLAGATIALYQGSAVVKQTQSDGNGDFTIQVPGNGEFIMMVSYQDCNPKKFEVSTKVPPKFNTENWKPTFSIEGVIMAKPLYSIDYSALKKPLARIIFMNESKKIDDDESYTDQILDALKKLKDTEDELIEKFVTAAKAGDAALKKPDCPLAKAMYEKCLSLIPGEQYPTEQLLKVGDCLKDAQNAEKAIADKKAAETKAAEEKSKRDQEEKLAREKAEREAELARQQQKEADKQQKNLADKAAREKADAGKELLAKQKEEEKKKKEEAERLVQKRAEDEKRKEKESIAASDARKKKEEKKPEPVKNVKENAAPKKTVVAEKKKENEPVKKKQSEEGGLNKNVAVKEDKKPAGEFEPDSRSSSMRKKKRNSGYRVPYLLGADRYKESIKKADDYFGNKQYDEARVLYQEALNAKQGDEYATARMAEISKLLPPK